MLYLDFFIRVTKAEIKTTAIKNRNSNIFNTPYLIIF